MKKRTASALAALLVFPSFTAALTGTALADNGSDGEHLYLTGGPLDKGLTEEPQGDEDLEIVPESQDPVVFEMDGVNGEYIGGATETAFYLNGLEVATIFHADVHYDFNGDGNWDRTSRTPIMPADGNVESGTFELFEESFSESITGSDYQDFDNGTIRLEVSIFESDDADGEIKVNGDEEASLLSVPYDFDATGSNGNGHDDDDGETNWQVTFEDEFDGNELDTDTWRIDIGNGFYDGDEWVDGWGNNESQSYQEDNVFLEDDKLVLEAREEHIVDDFGEGGEFDYTSGKVLTDESFSQRYGRFEASMKLPEGQGYWPAFWMMPQDDIYGGWAASGEIDIMENRGSDTSTVGAAIHYGDLWPNNTYSEQEYDFPEGQYTTDFNEYAIEWEPGEIRWYVNDELYSTKTEWGTEYGEYPAPFDQEFHMILNLAVGGWYGGEPDETTEFPGRVEVDYVRVYEDPDAEYPPPGEYIEPGDDEENGDEETPPLDGSDWPEIGDNLVVDGTFETTTEFGDENDSLVWNVFNMADHDPNGGLADFSIVNEELRAEIQQVGWGWYHMQFMQDIEVPEGFYKIEFDMRSEEDRPMYVELAGSDSGIQEIAVGEDMETHEAYIYVEEGGDYNLMFGFGREEDDVEPPTPYTMYMDNVRLVEVDGELPEAPEDDEDDDTPGEDVNWIEAGDNLIVDGTFEETTEFGDEDNRMVWDVFNMGDHEQYAGLANFSIVDEQLHAEIEQVGWEWWHIQFMQQLMVDAGDYKIEFDMMSEEERTMYVELAGSESGVNEFEVGPDMETYTTYINVEDPGEFDMLFGFGRDEDDPELDVPYNMVLDNVRLVPVEADEDDAPGHSFSDVPENHWAAHYIQSLTDRGVIQGYNENEFRPATAVTRGQFVAMLARNADLTPDTPGEKVFTDQHGVLSDEITAAYEAGIVQGFTDGSFGQDDYITREEMAIMLVRAYEELTGDALPVDMELTYHDKGHIGATALPYVTAITQAGVLEGTGGGHFLPKNNTFRDQSAKAMYYFLEAIE